MQSEYFFCFAREKKVEKELKMSYYRLAGVLELANIAVEKAERVEK